LCWCRRNKRFNTPHNAVFASLVVIFVLIKFDFDAILNMTNALSAFYQLLIFAAFIKLRYTQPELHRPYKGAFRSSSLDRVLESDEVAVACSSR
jgi:amino acid transporter